MGELITTDWHDSQDYDQLSYSNTQLNLLSHKKGYLNTQQVLRQLKPVEPIYLFCPKELKQRAQYFQKHFPGSVSYAVKANPHINVIQALLSQDIHHFDVASLNEIHTIFALAPHCCLHFNNPIKSTQAISSAYHHYNVRSFALDDEAELNKILSVIENIKDLTLSVRFKLNNHQASYDFGSKFGATSDTAIALLKKIKSYGAKASLTFHPGSQCTSPNSYVQYLQEAHRIMNVAQVNVEQINVGGGFPEPYTNNVAPPLHQYLNTIKQNFKQIFSAHCYLPKLMCEPGRSMVANCCSLITQIIHIRADRSAVYLNDGLYGGLQEQSLVNLMLPIKYWQNNQQINSKNHTLATCFGPTCDPCDRLPKQIKIPTNIKTGDYLEFGLCGAYASATSTQFNGFSSEHYAVVENGFYH